MEELFLYQTNVMKLVRSDFKRYLYSQLPWEHRFIAIQGLRGVGKTTLMLQYLKSINASPHTHLYASLEHPYFYNRSIYEFALEFSQLGGQLLLLDEVHKYPNWSREIKLIYDGIPDLQVIFSSSSLIELFKGEADLSRRVLRFELPGLSFREYLNFITKSDFAAITVDDLFSQHLEMSQNLLDKLKPIALFRKYIQTGYFPFQFKDPQTNRMIINQVLDTVLSVDIAQAYGYDMENISKLRKLLAILADSVPFTINVSAVASKMGISRNTLKSFMHELQKARIINFLNQSNKGLSKLQKPDKIYLENTNFSYAFSMSPELGNLRETFVVNQLRNAQIEISLPKKGDLYLGEYGITLEIGGKNKTGQQIKGIGNSFLVKDDIEIGSAHSIPLWLFGFLY